MVNHSYYLDMFKTTENFETVNYEEKLLKLKKFFRKLTSILQKALIFVIAKFEILGQAILSCNFYSSLFAIDFHCFLSLKKNKLDIILLA